MRELKYRLPYCRRDGITSIGSSCGAGGGSGRSAEAGADLQSGILEVGETVW